MVCSDRGSARAIGSKSSAATEARRSTPGGAPGPRRTTTPPPPPPPARALGALEGGHAGHRALRGRRDLGRRRGVEHGARQRHHQRAIVDREQLRLDRPVREDQQPLPLRAHLELEPVHGDLARARRGTPGEADTAQESEGPAPMHGGKGDDGHPDVNAAARRGLDGPATDRKCGGNRMRIPGCSAIAGLAAIAAAAAGSPAHGAELYLSGDLGISWVDGDGVGVNDIVGIANSGMSDDATPVYGGALGLQFPLNAALPWRMRVPGFGVPYWPGHEWRFDGRDDVRLPDWTVRTEVEHLRGRDAQLTTASFTPLDAYRSDAESWTLMGKLRLDIPVRSPVHALLGRRAPFLEPATIYGRPGARIAPTDPN